MSKYVLHHIVTLTERRQISAEMPSRSYRTTENLLQFLKLVAENSDQNQAHCKGK